MPTSKPPLLDKPKNFDGRSWVLGLLEYEERQEARGSLLTSNMLFGSSVVFEVQPRHRLAMPGDQNRLGPSRTPCQLWTLRITEGSRR